MRRCFHLDEGSTRTTIVLEGEGAAASMTVHEQSGGEPVAAAVTIPGTLSPEGFTVMLVSLAEPS